MICYNLGDLGCFCYFITHFPNHENLSALKKLAKEGKILPPVLAMEQKTNSLCFIYVNKAKRIRHKNCEFYDHFWVDDIVFAGILGKFKLVYHWRKSILIKSFDIIDLLTL